MKTIFTLLASLFLGSSVFAAARPNSAITVKSMDNTEIRVELDGKRFEPNDNIVMIEGLAQGSHTVRVYKRQSTGFFSIVSKSYKLAYTNTVSLKKRTHLFITIEKSGLISMAENKIGKAGQVSAGTSGSWGDYDTNYGYDAGMNSAEFNRVLQSVDKEWLEGNKIKSATQVVRANRLSTVQVKQLIQLFSFENNKLELAKQAYENTVDKRNYSQIFDLFSFGSSRTELDRYIKNYR